MSHLSKIKTNISNLDILKQTINDLGFFYKLSKSSERNTCLSVYSSKLEKVILCNFEYDGLSYSLITDIQLWNLGMQFDNFYEKLKQKYAHNIVLQQTNKSGFSKISEQIMSDGSIRVLVQKWN